VVELQQVAIGLAPDRDRPRHARDAPEAAEEHDHLADVVAV